MADKFPLIIESSGFPAELASGDFLKASGFKVNAINLLPALTILGSDQTTTATAMGDVTGLQVSLLSGIKYQLDGILLTSCSTANGIKLGLTITNANIILGYILGTNTAANNNRMFPITTAVGGSVGTFNMVAITGIITLSVCFTTTSTGTATMNFGAQTAGDTCKVLANSFFKLSQVI